VKSIRKQLTVSVLLVTFGLSAIAGVSIYVYARKALLRQHDEALAGNALALSRLVAWNEKGKLILEIPPTALLEFRQEQRPSYFEIFRGDGTVFARSQSLKGGELAPPQMNENHWSLALPDGREGRAIAYRFLPHNEADEPDAGAEARENAVPHPQEEITLVLASDQQEVNQFLDHLIEAILLVGALAVVLLVVAVVTTVRRGLRPLEQLSKEAERFEPGTKASRFSYESLPAELQPIVGRLNDLLRRVEETLRRERRFAADAAHELRTPIAELRNLADVALKWPEGESETARDFGEVRLISHQMEGLVESLLAMSRGKGQKPVVAERQEDLAALVELSWKSFSRKAEGKELRVTWTLTPTMISTDRALLSPILRNLLSNAVEHTVVGGQIWCRIDRGSDYAELEISNSSSALSEEDLAHILEPFWRKDVARGTGEHVGLGLAVAAEYGRLLGVQLRPAIVKGDRFFMRVRFPIVSKERGERVSEEKLHS